MTNETSKQTSITSSANVGAPQSPASFQTLGGKVQIARAAELWMAAKRCEFTLNLLQTAPTLANAGKSISTRDQMEITRWLPELKDAKAVLDALVLWPIAFSQPSLEPPKGGTPPHEMPEYADLIGGIVGVLSRDLGLLIRSEAIPEAFSMRDGVPVWASVSFIRATEIPRADDGSPRVRTATDLDLGFPPQHPRAVSIWTTFDDVFERLWECIQTFREQLEAAPTITMSKLFPSAENFTEAGVWVLRDRSDQEASECSMPRGTDPRDSTLSTPLVDESSTTALLTAEQPGQRPPDATPRRMKVAEANLKAQELANSMGEDFFKLSRRAQAKLIGCAYETWTKTALFEVAKTHRPTKHARPRAASLSDELLATLAAQQQKDYEPSPLDESPKPNPVLRKRA